MTTHLSIIMDSESDCSMELEQACKPFKLPCLVPLDVLKARYSRTLEVDWLIGEKDILPPYNETTNGRHSLGSNGSDSSGIENDRRITFVNLSDDSHSDGEIDDISTTVRNLSSSRAFRSSLRTNGAYSPDDSKFTVPHIPSIISKKTPKRFLSNHTTAKDAKNNRTVNEYHGKRLTTTSSKMTVSTASTSKRSDGDMSCEARYSTKRKHSYNVTRRRSEREPQQKVLTRQLPQTPGGQPIIIDGQDIIDTKNHVEDTMIAFLPEMCQRLGLTVVPQDPMELCLKFKLVVPHLDLKTDDTLNDGSMED